METLLLRYYREIIKIHRKEFKAIKKNHNTKKPDYLNNEIITEQSEVVGEQTLKREIKRCKEILKMTRDIRIRLLLEMIRKQFLFYIVLFIPSTLQLLSVGEISLWGIMITWIMYVIIFAITAWILSKRDYREFTRTRIVSDIMKIEEERGKDNLHNTIYQTLSSRIPNQKGIKEYLADDNVFNVIHVVSVSLIGMIATVILTGVLLQNTNNEFYIYKSDGKSYVLLYQIESVLYFEKVKEIDDTLIIDITDQRIIKGDDVCLEYKKYKKVIKTDDMCNYERDLDL